MVPKPIRRAFGWLAGGCIVLAAFSAEQFSAAAELPQRLAKGPKTGEGRNRLLEPSPWEEDHWLADIPYTWDAYLDSSYARFNKLIAAKSRLFSPPLARGENLSINFDNEFWVAKQADWAFQVEAVPDMSRGYDVGGSGALGEF